MRLTLLAAVMSGAQRGRRHVPVNLPPTVNAGIDQSVTTGATVNLSASASDPDGTIAGYLWTQISGTAVTINSPTTSTPNFTAPGSTATIVIRCTVIDNLGATAFDDVQIAVGAAGFTYDTRIGLGVDTSTGERVLALDTAGTPARGIYVRNTGGNDGNDGLTYATACATPSGGISKIRPGVGDWVLLRDGDTYTGGLTGLTGSRSGKSAAYPTLFTTFDPTDPTNPAKWRKGRVTIDASTGFLLNENTNNLVFERVDFFNTTQCEWVIIGAANKNLLFWWCRFRKMQVSVEANGIDSDLLGGRITNVVFSHCSNAFSEVQGFYVNKTGTALFAGDGLTFEYCVIDHAGWNGATRSTGTVLPDIFKHNIYMSEVNYSTVLRGNVSTRAGSHGTQARGGATAVDNFYALNPLSLLIGGGTSPAVTRPSGVECLCLRNIVNESENINATEPRGGPGLDFINIASGGEAANNLMVNNSSTPLTNAAALIVHVVSGMPVHLNFHDNIIWNWPGNAVYDYPNGPNVVFNNNIFPYDPVVGTNRQAPLVAFSDPNRTLATYAAANGYASADALCDFMALHPETHWHKLLADYVNPGFNL